MANYIDWTGHGAMAVAPPALFTGARAAAFAFRYDRDAARGLVDQLLTPAGGGNVTYRPLGGHAMVSFMHIARCSSPKRNGWASGRECAVWLPLLEVRSGAPPRPVIWAPYVCIDYAIGLATGREVWGWPKTYGRMLAPGEAGQPDYVCSTMIFRDTDRDDEGREEPLLTIMGAGAPVARPDLDESTAIRVLTELLLGGDLMAGELGGFGPTVPAIALKQFPDSARPTVACYQAIVNSPCRVTAFRAAGGFEGEPALLIANCKSHRIAADLLGKPVATSGHTAVPIVWSAWFEFDFEALAGSVIAP